MAIILSKYATSEPIPFTVEFNGDTLQFYAKRASIHSNLVNAKRVNSAEPEANIKKLFADRLLDDEMQPVTKEWVDELLTTDGLEVLFYRINNEFTKAVGLDEIVAKKG